MGQKFLYRLYIGALRIPALLPLGVLYLLSDAIYFFIYHVIHYRKDTVRENLLNAFPEKSPEERKAVEKRFYRHLGDCIVETVKLLHISDREIDRRVEVANPGVIDAIAAEGRSIVLYLGHYGNWEWMQAIRRHFRKPQVAGQIYKPMRDPVMEKVMLKIRSRFSMLCIPQKKAYRTLLGFHERNRQFIIGFISDQRPNGGYQHWTSFLNQETAYIVGGEQIGKRVGAAFLYLDVEKDRRGHYILTLREIVPPPELMQGEYPYTRQFMSMLEQTIRREPAYWLWSHKRWKVKRSDCESNK